MATKEEFWIKISSVIYFTCQNENDRLISNPSNEKIFNLIYMSKKPTPKKKTPRTATKKRYASFVTKKVRKLKNKVLPLVAKYKGKDIIQKNKKGKNITKIAA